MEDMQAAEDMDAAIRIFTAERDSPTMGAHIIMREFSSTKGVLPL